MSKDFKIDGQMDFFNMFSSYTDDTGASVKVSTPHSDFKPRKSAGGGITIKDAEPMSDLNKQLSLDEFIAASDVKNAASDVKKEEEPESNKSQTDFLFGKCSKCWCYDCKHNSRNEGKPRDMCGVMMPCPACDSCVSEGFAEVCEIGSAKEGCMTRALEEGIVIQDEY